MTYKLFIDDERFPVTDDWIIARSSSQALNVVISKGFPIEIAFDHDLGGDDTSMLFIHKIVDLLYDGHITIPKGFTYSVHSQNPIGVANIKGLMDNVLMMFGSN